MIPIEKAKEPPELLRYRKGRDATYEDMPKDVKQAVLRQLIKEQGQLCAYCMARLEGLESYSGSIKAVTIEHWAPRNPHEGANGKLDLDYRNLFAVCDGNRGSSRKSSLTCDASKGNRAIAVNPLRPNTLSGIYYTSSGEIHSTNDRIDRDLVETLNLNSEAASLPQRRKSALDALCSFVNVSYGTKTAKREALSKLLTYYESQTDEKTEFVGILTWWLKRRIAR